MKNLLIISAFVVIAVLARGIGRNLATPTVSDNPEKSAFVGGCATAEGMTDSICICIYDRLTEKYGYTYIRDNAARFANGDVTDEELDTIRICV